MKRKRVFALLMALDHWDFDTEKDLQFLLSVSVMYASYLWMDVDPRPLRRSTFLTPCRHPRSQDQLCANEDQFSEDGFC